MTDPMITAANTLEASPKPSYGPHKVSERYLDAEDVKMLEPIAILDLRADWQSVPVSEALKIIETLRTHLRKKYYAG